jgi:hypothetical protein
VSEAYSGKLFEPLYLNQVYRSLHGGGVEGIIAMVDFYQLASISADLDGCGGKNSHQSSVSRHAFEEL